MDGARPRRGVAEHTRTRYGFCTATPPFSRRQAALCRARTNRAIRVESKVCFACCKTPPALRLAATVRYTSAMPDSTILPPAAPPCDDCGRPLTPATYRHFYDLDEGTRVLCLRCWDTRNSTSWRRLSLRLPTPLRADRSHEGDAAPPVPDRDTP